MDEEVAARVYADPLAHWFVTEAYKHLKTMGAFGAGIDLLRKAGIGDQLADGHDVVAAAGVVSTTAAENSMPEEFFEAFVSALAKHRAWDRQTDSVPA